MISFTKLHGTGNDYIFIDSIKNNLAGKDLAALSRSMSDRHFGIGSDGIILILPSEKADFRMRMFNSDGSESAMCGNGIRGFGKYVFDRGLVASKDVTIETDSGIKILNLMVEDGKVTGARVDMGIPLLDRAEIPMKGTAGKVIDEPIALVDGTVLKLTAVSMGNPHAVIFVDDTKKFNVEKYGREIEHSPLFPERTNVEFVTLSGKDEVIQRTWERGAGETLACGTGASAVCVASNLTGRTGRKIVSHLSGGDLTLDWNEQSGHLFMTGPAVEVFSGEWAE